MIPRVDAHEEIPQIPPVAHRSDPDKVFEVVVSAAYRMVSTSSLAGFTATPPRRHGAVRESSVPGVRWFCTLGDERSGKDYSVVDRIVMGVDGDDNVVAIVAPCLYAEPPK